MKNVHQKPEETVMLNDETLEWFPLALGMRWHAHLHHLNRSLLCLVILQHHQSAGQRGNKLGFHSSTSVERVPFIMTFYGFWK